MRSGALVKTLGEPKGRKGPLCWIVPRDIRPSLPAGFGYVGYVKQFPVQAGDGHEVPVSLTMWPDKVVDAAFGMLLVSSVLVRLSSTGGPRMPDYTSLSPRCLWAAPVTKATQLGLCAMQRWDGEVLAVPLRVIDEEVAPETCLGASLRRIGSAALADEPVLDARICR